mgnify:CR=1 FL=1|jgi:MerR family transcriptional regulator/heat shock protein HspR
MKDRPLYSISVVSEMLELHPQTLRQYERLGFVKPSRTIGNTRLYSEEDIEKLKVIINLTRDLGVNIAGVEIIINMRSQIEDLQGILSKLIYFIKNNISATNIKDSEVEANAIVPAKPRGIIKIDIEKED